MFGHIDRQAKAEFIQLHVEGVQQPLELSSNHMVFLEDNKAVKAASVQVGDRLDNKVVTRVSTITRKGYYAPYTYEGELLVNGLRASSYGTIVEKVSGAVQHQVIHMIMSLPRLVCSNIAGVCDNNTEVFTNKIADNLVVPSVSVLTEVSAQKGWVGVAALLLLLALFAPVYGLEQVLAHPAIAVCVAFGWMVYKKKSTPSNAAKIKVA